MIEKNHNEKALKCSDHISACVPSARDLTPTFRFHLHPHDAQNAFTFTRRTFVSNEFQTLHHRYFRLAIDTPPVPTSPSELVCPSRCEWIYHICQKVMLLCLDVEQILTRTERRTAVWAFRNSVESWVQSCLLVSRATA